MKEKLLLILHDQPYYQSSNGRIASLFSLIKTCASAHYRSEHFPPLLSSTQFRLCRDISSTVLRSRQLHNPDSIKTCASARYTSEYFPPLLSSTQFTPRKKYPSTYANIHSSFGIHWAVSIYRVSFGHVGRLNNFQYDRKC